MNWLNYHHLLYFRVIANEGGIAKASRRLRLGQPTLSTQLKRLEESIGQPLFERRNRRLVLTEAGKIALNYANEIFKLGDEMVEAVHDRLTTSRVHLSVAALDSVPKRLILQLVRQAYNLGDCTVSILEGKGEDIAKELHSHRVDLVLANYALNASEHSGVRSRLVGSMPVVICAAPELKHLRKGFPQSLQGQKMVMPTKHSKLRHDLDHYFQSLSINVDVVAETQDTALLKLLGTEGIGLVPIPDAAAEDLVTEKKLVVLGQLPSVQEQLWLISASRKIENPIAAELMKHFSVSTPSLDPSAQ